MIPNSSTVSSDSTVSTAVSAETTTGRAARRRLAAAVALAGGAVLLAAGPASAHVGVQPEEAEQGGYSTVAIKVPNEKDDASTVKVELFLPADHPLASVSVRPLPGWTVKVEKKKLDKPIDSGHGKLNEAVSKITWSGGKIGPGQFQMFDISLGPLPENTGQLTFKALQTYDDKEVVRWIEPTKEGAEEPERPAPTLKLVKGTGDEHGGGADKAPAKDKASGEAKSGRSNEAGASGTSAAAEGSSDSTARTLGITGIVVGALGVAFGVFGVRRRAGGKPSA